MKRTLAMILLGFSVACSTATGAQAPGTANVENSSLRLIAPKPGEKLATNVVEVEYELTQPASASGTPNFILRLDGREPVRTTSTTHTFTSLAPGSHTVTVELVDANDTPIAGTRAEVRFIVLDPATRRPGGSASTPLSGLRNASFQQAPRLPRTGSALPLLSVIGMGVLLGGLVSAMKSTR